MADKPINWLDIFVHCAVSLPMAAGAGAALQMGLAHGGVPGTVLAVLGAASGLAVALYWPLRERIQHGWEWGGRQSQAEWLGPVLVTPIGMIAGWFLSYFLL